MLHHTYSYMFVYAEIRSLLDHRRERESVFDQRSRSISTRSISWFIFLVGSRICVCVYLRRSIRTYGRYVYLFLRSLNFFYSNRENAAVTRLIEDNFFAACAIDICSCVIEIAKLYCARWHICVCCTLLIFFFRLRHSPAYEHAITWHITQYRARGHTAAHLWLINISNIARRL